MYKRISSVSVAAAAGLALADSLSGWQVNILALLVIATAIGVAAIVFQRSWLRRTVAILATLCFGLHIATLIRIDEVTKNWETVRSLTADEVLSQSHEFIEQVVAELAGNVATAVEDPRIAQNLKTSSAKPLFDVLAEISHTGGWRGGATGLAIADRSGRIVAWQAIYPTVSVSILRMGWGQESESDRVQPMTGLRFGGWLALVVIPWDW